jgi:CDP-glucose 4,6-dehydratase
LKNFFKNKTVLVTGHTGFKGSWLSLVLLKFGARVIGVSNDLKKNSLFKYIDEKKIISIKEDVRNLKALKKIFNEHKPQVVFHLAAQAIVGEGYKDPINTFTTNIIGSLNVAECVRTYDGIESTIMITSDKCYKNQEWQWGYRENDMLGGLDPYSSSKASAEIVLYSFFKSFKDNLGGLFCTTRAGNVVGGGDFSEGRLIPDIVRSIKSKKPILLRNPKATRPWQHVLEPISGYLKLATQKANIENSFSESIGWNFGPENISCIEVSKFVSKLSNYLNLDLSIKNRNDEVYYESQLLELNCEKAKKYLKWKPKLNIDETIKWTGDWYNQYFENENSLISITNDQIEEYFGD